MTTTINSFLKSLSILSHDNGSAGVTTFCQEVDINKKTGEILFSEEVHERYTIKETYETEHAIKHKLNDIVKGYLFIHALEIQRMLEKQGQYTSRIDNLLFGRIKYIVDELLDMIQDGDDYYPTVSEISFLSDQNPSYNAFLIQRHTDPMNLYLEFDLDD